MNRYNGYHSSPRPYNIYIYILYICIYISYYIIVLPRNGHLKLINPILLLRDLSELYVHPRTSHGIFAVRWAFQRQQIQTECNWLVVFRLPLWKIWKSVGIIIPNIWKKNVPNHQPGNDNDYNLCWQWPYFGHTTAQDHCSPSIPIFPRMPVSQKLETNSPVIFYPLVN